jgi:AraC-like DNA-binding protein
MESLFRQLTELVSGQPPAYEIKASAILSLMLGELFASRSPRTDATSLPQSRPLSLPVRRSLDYIARFYEYPLTVKQIAAKAGQSLHYFSRLFHREVGLPPIMYLNRHRVERAKALLEMSNKSIEEIAHTIGFADPDYFARAFGKIVGVSPRQYRWKSQRATQTRNRRRLIETRR